MSSESNHVETYIARQEARLERSWELVYSADATDTATAYITITNTGAESTDCLWKLLDYTNNDSTDCHDDLSANIASEAALLASGNILEIKGNSSVTHSHVITITDEMRDNPSGLQLTVTPYDSACRDDNSEIDELVADDVDNITFAALDSLNNREKTISWQAVEGASSYILQYALEGDWDESGGYINDISGTSYSLSASPGEYSYRVIGVDSDGNAIGTWSEEKDSRYYLTPNTR